MTDKQTQTTKRTNDVSTEDWLRFYFRSPVGDDNSHRLFMTNFIERIQQSSYSDGYTDGKCDEIDRRIGMEDEQWKDGNNIAGEKKARNDTNHLLRLPQTDVLSPSQPDKHRC